MLMLIILEKNIIMFSCIKGLGLCYEEVFMLKLATIILNIFHVLMGYDDVFMLKRSYDEVFMFKWVIIRL